MASDIPFKLDDNGHVVVTDSNQNSISENGSILLKDALTSIRILKVDAATNTPLAGAHIQIKDGETIVQEFNSTEDNAGIQINGLKTGVVYTLHESSAPANYTLATDTTFSLNADGSINLEKTNTDFEINNGSIVLSVKDVQISKTTYSVQKEWDDNNNALNNRPSTIQVQLQSKLGDGEFTNDGGAITLSQDNNWTYTWNDLPSSNDEGTKYTYQAVEVGKSENYLDPSYRYDDSKKIHVITNKSYPVVEISKTNVLGDEIQSAVLTLVDTNKNEVARWTSGSETNEDGTIKPHYVQVAPGTYTLHEEVTPDNNYVLAQDITFTVNENGVVTMNDTVVDHVTMVDEYNTHLINVSKVDISGNEIAGASMKITGTPTGSESKITPIEWVSGSDGNTKNISVKPGTYTLHEEATPDNNYVLAQDITFKVDSEGTISVDGKPVERVTMVDDYNNHPVEISKIDVGGKELAGAQLSVVDTNGITIDSWTSSAKIHKVTVKPGTYTLHEDLSPVGYKIVKDITFDVDIEGKVTVNGKKVDQVVMVDEDQTYDIAISKQDITNNKELPGAKLSLKDTKTNKVVETWTSASEAHVVTVVPSTYELSEVAAPNGYEIAEKITFTVERDGTITIDGKKVETVIMQDQPTKPIVDTSDHNNIVFFGITGVISLGLAFMMLLTRKKIH